MLVDKFFVNGIVFKDPSKTFEAVWEDDKWTIEETNTQVTKAITKLKRKLNGKLKKKSTLYN